MNAVLYTWTWCPYCVRAKAILDRKGIAYEEIAMDGLNRKLNEIKARYNHWTVPIILLDGEFIGGCNELEALERDGQLG
jgi:glutaredoxin 3